MMPLKPRVSVAPLISVSLEGDGKIVTARQRARQISSHLGFSVQDQVRIATAVSEMARTAVQYAGRGRVDFGLWLEPPEQMLLVQVSDCGPESQNCKEGSDDSSGPMCDSLQATQ